MRVTKWRIRPEFADREQLVRAAACAAEAGLNHPIAEALRREESASELPEVKLLERRIVPGQGVIATLRLRDVAGVRDPGQTSSSSNGAGQFSTTVIAIGEPTLRESLPADKPPEMLSSVAGKSVSVFWDGTLAAEIELGESWRDGLVETLDQLATLGVAAEVLSGDPGAEVALREVVSISQAQGRATVRGGMTPLAKTEWVRLLQTQGRTVAFAGDGLNDAAALSAADASIAVKSGTDLARASAMALLVGDDLRAIPAAIRLAREVRQSIRTNLLFAAAYNLVGVILAAMGWLHPVAAALLMLGSSVFVSVRALRAAGRSEASREPTSAVRGLG
jgi:cation transport ATPase